MKLGLSIATVLATLTTATPALADPPAWAHGASRYSESSYDAQDRDGAYDRHGDDGDGYTYARVTHVEPLVHRVAVDRPARDCWDETHQVRYDTDDGRTVGSTLLGGIIGGVIGHQIGHGAGRDVATVAGAVIGSAVGHNTAERNSSPPVYEDRTVQRCSVRYERNYEERVDGYRVSYRYNGRDYVTQLPYDPGQRIRVRVAVAPAE
jgi:uncharacterized protein YcfJ